MCRPKENQHVIILKNIPFFTEKVDKHPNEETVEGSTVEGHTVEYISGKTNRILLIDGHRFYRNGASKSTAFWHCRLLKSLGWVSRKDHLKKHQNNTFLPSNEQVSCKMQNQFENRRWSSLHPIYIIESQSWHKHMHQAAIEGQIINNKSWSENQRRIL